MLDIYIFYDKIFKYSINQVFIKLYQLSGGVILENAKPFAWQGISLKIPEEWDLGAVSGDSKEGYFRLDDSEDVRLEVRWRREKEKADIEKVLEKYVQSLKEGVKRKKLPFTEIKPRDIFDAISLRDKERKIFSWRSDSREVLNLVSQCSHCNTILMAQASVTEKDAEKLPDILKSLEDHTTSDMNQWAVYDFKFSMPTFFTLDKFSLRSGYLEFNFSGPGAEVKLRRWGLADVLLKGGSFEKWARTASHSVLSGKIGPDSRREEPPHEIIDVKLKRWSWHAFYARKCSELNKIYAFNFTGKKEETLFDRITSKIMCH